MFWDSMGVMKPMWARPQGRITVSHYQACWSGDYGGHTTQHALCRGPRTHCIFAMWGPFKSPWPTITPCGMGPIRCEVVTPSCPRTRMSRDHDHANGAAVIQPVGTAQVVTGIHHIPVGITLGNCGCRAMSHVLCRGTLDTLSLCNVGTRQIIVANYSAMWHGAHTM